MKKKLVTFIAVVCLFGANIGLGADRYQTLVKDDDLTASNITIKADEVCTVMLFYYDSLASRATLTVTVGATTIDMAQLYTLRQTQGASSIRPFYPGQWAVAGPATLTLTGVASGKSILTVKVSPNPNIMGVKQ